MARKYKPRADRSDDVAPKVLLNFSERMLNEIDNEVMRSGRYMSRQEWIREACREKLTREVVCETNQHQ